MKKIVFALIAISVFGCAPQSKTVAIAGETKVDTKPIIPHPITEDPEYKAAHPEGSPAVKQAVPDQAKPKPAEIPDKPTKIDPAIVGVYKLRIAEQERAALKAGLEDLEKQAEKGDQAAKHNLEMAKRYAAIAEKMTVSLTADGTYQADFGGGDSIGTFKMFGTKVIVTPNEKIADKNMPTDVSMDFDKEARTLTVDYKGTAMVFEKKS